MILQDIPVRQETFWEQRCLFSVLLPAPENTQIRRKIKIIGYIQDIHICINNKLWKGEKEIGLNFLWFLFLTHKKNREKKKKRERKSQAVLILSRPVHKSQVINPHDIPGCWILHLELWKTDSWKIYKIPGSQCAAYWLHIWEVTASCLAQKAGCMGYIVLKNQRTPTLLFSDVMKAKNLIMWCGWALFGTLLHRQGDNYKLGVPKGCCLLLQNYTMVCVVDVLFILSSRSDHKLQNYFSCFEYMLNFVPFNIIGVTVQ